jgi:hypothetical protein
MKTVYDLNCSMAYRNAVRRNGGQPRSHEARPQEGFEPLARFWDRGQARRDGTRVFCWGVAVGAISTVAAAVVWILICRGLTFAAAPAAGLWGQAVPTPECFLRGLGLVQRTGWAGASPQIPKVAHQSLLTVVETADTSVSPARRVYRRATFDFAGWQGRRSANCDFYE